MLSITAFEHWKKLFDNELGDIWQNEVNEELKSLSMLLVCFKREMKKVSSILDTNILKVRDAVTRKTVLNSSNDHESLGIDENKMDSNLSSCSLVILSDDDLVNPMRSKTKLNNSADVKRKRINAVSQKKKQKLKFGEQTKQFEKLASLNSNNTKRSPQKKKGPRTPSKKDSLRPITEYLKRQVTPLKAKNNLDSPLVIEGTPDLSIPKKSDVVQCLFNTKLFSQLSFNSDKSDQSNPFSDSEVRELEFDETFIEDDKNGTRTEMSINEIVKYINNSKSTEENTGIAKNNEKTINEPAQDESIRLLFQTSKTPLKKDDVKKSGNDFPRGLNEFLAEAQKITDAPTTTAITENRIVRGKARKDLPGWSCQECEMFYINQGMNTDEILRLNKCSRHRAFRPRENTLPGYWDMTMTTQPSKETS